MKLQEYLDNLITMIKDNPKIAEFEVIYSHDDEGNEFQKVGMPPSLMRIDDLSQDRNLDPWFDGDYNAICIN
jgi:hypothetical protein